MALNPLTFTEKVVADFLRYQLTTYPFSDDRLHVQLRTLLSLDDSRRSPLVKGPYVSLSRAFREGAPMTDLVAQGILHQLLANLHPYPRLYGHQEEAIRAIEQGHPTLVSTGTGSGKTECFLYPVISRCLRLADESAPPGIVAVLVYPMNALAEDQLVRLRDLLAGTGISFGMYVGKTPRRTADVAGQRLPSGASRADYRAVLARAREERRETAVHPFEERVSREQMQTPGKQPRILLTNVKQLELLLTRQADIQMFDGARLDFLVFDEAHTFGGAAGGETACLIRRLREFCGRRPDQTVCIGTSATLTSPGLEGTAAGREFAARFFGVDEERVRVIGEQYQLDDWAQQRRASEPPPGEISSHLRAVLSAMDEGEQAGRAVAAAFQGMTGFSLPADNWQEALYSRLAENDLCYRLAEALSRAKPLETLASELAKGIGRPVPEEEIVSWLVLGAASRRADRPLLRPVVHGFIRGIDGAIVTFPQSSPGPSLGFSAQEEAKKDESERLFPLPITTCSTCGQHYFVHFVQDLRVEARGLGGGEAVEDRRVWRALDEAQGGCRVVLIDRLVSASDDDGDPPRTHETFFCRRCGALHSEARSVCDACGRQGELVRLLAVQYGERHPGWLVTCLSCGAPGRPWGGRYREPARPVRAVPVSDVHVLAQNMLQQADRRRLLVFADNRQDAAFQAGWMRDHARRFRLRALMAERIERVPVSVGDLVAHLDDLLDDDDELSQALLPEVWTVARKEGAGVQHGEERKYFLRISVLREIATGPKQRVGLEPWGRLKVTYRGLNPETAFVRTWATRLALSPEVLADGVAALVDLNRRSLLVLDREGGIFSKYWAEGDKEIQRGYLPLIRGVPRGLKLERAPGDDVGRVSQWLSARGDTVVRKAARRFGVPNDDVEDFIRQLWNALRDDLRLLAPVTLKGQRGNALPNCPGVHQIDADLLLLEQHRGLWRCDTCQRAQVRPTPNSVCLAWRCDGMLVHEEEERDDYDLLALDQRFAMLRPAEHSAQVPPIDRERLERAFKAEGGESVNTLVCTPTLELGVDIGGLDTVLLRNVPPLPSNYWQRAGRAVRRHRLAVNLTYARTVSHDRAYFADPMKLLDGRVEPPRFNLKNELMVAKHVHAAVLTRLWSLSRVGASLLAEDDRAEVEASLRAVLPAQVKDYLFDEAGSIRPEPLTVEPLNTVVTKHQVDLIGYVVRAFRDTWPKADNETVAEERLREVVLGTAADLEAVIRRVKKRLDWCLMQMARLDQERQRKGTLDPDEDALRMRCDRLVKRLKGQHRRQRSEGEGYDDTNTYGMLAFEGFLPGYGLEIGSVRATAMVPRSAGGGEFELPRPPAMALREYVPGNLIYANGRRFMARYFHLEAKEPVLFQVDTAHQAVTEVGAAAAGAVATLGAAGLKAVSVCDVDLIHFSHISDEEEYRFQLPVAVYGYETGRHGRGRMYTWGDRTLSLRKNVGLRLVNVGPAQLVRQGRLGYPLCLVTGQSRSPLASDRELTEFNKAQEERTGKSVEKVGFFADITADALTLPNCPSREEAYSVCEALRIGMSQVLDMEPDDLEVLVVGHSGSDAVDALLYDPMPGGSGLLEQACMRWGEVVGEAVGLLQTCASACPRSCIDCMQTFRNSFFHNHLNRHVAIDCLGEWETRLDPLHDIPERVAGAGASQQTKPVNEAEAELGGMLDRAGFPPGEWHKQIQLGKPLGSTSPDVFWPGDDPREPGVCLYLDGLSEHIHGNPATAARDREIRAELTNLGYEVFAIPATQLADPKAMGDHFFRLARVLMDKETGRRLRDDTAAWFASSENPPQSVSTRNGSEG